MLRYKITIEYDGSNYSGWQRQRCALSIQGAIERAIYAFTGFEVTVYGAGRTDAGVHAIGQTAHFDLATGMSSHNICNAINFHLRPAPIVILNVAEVSPDWHARFSACRKTYIYKIINRTVHSVLDRNRALHVIRTIDLGALRKAGSILVGRHDFSSFRSSECQAQDAIRTLDGVSVEVNGEKLKIIFQAKSFLHNQVRIMTGCMLACACYPYGTWSMENMLAARDRRKAAPTAPAHGLYLASVEY